MSTVAGISWSGPSGTFNLRVATVLDFRSFGLAAILPDLGGTSRHVALDRAAE